MKYLIIVAVIIVVAVAQRRYPIFERSCEQRKAHFNEVAKTNFNTAAVSVMFLTWKHFVKNQKFQYSGSWFEISRYQQRDEAQADCMISQYSWGFISRAFRIDRSGKDYSTNLLFNRNASASMAFPEERPLRGMLNVTYYGNLGLNLLHNSLVFSSCKWSELLHCRNWLIPICCGVGLWKSRI